MKQILILSGKGGTGKTTVASAFIKLANAFAYADCDVEAPNLHLALKHQSLAEKDFYGLPKAVIDNEKCIRCNLCYEHCRFRAIDKLVDYQVNLYACEGCGVCQLVCPTNAISLKKMVDGKLQKYEKIKIFSTAKLKMGSGNSGKLVTEVKNQIKDANHDLAIIDGPPGIGCPVIASLSGVDLVLIVTEPSIAGISDLKRIIETSRYFDVKIAVCINKFDTNLIKTKEIIDYCYQEELAFVGKIPFDKNVNNIFNQGKTIIDEDIPSRKAIKSIFKKTMLLFNKEGKDYYENSNCN